MKKKPDLLRPMRKRARITGPPPPAPEVLDGGEWQIRQSHSIRQAAVKMDKPGGIMVVPFGEEEQVRLVRAHELMHIHITPQEWPRPYNDQLMNLLEDGRVHRHLITTGFDLQPMTEVIPADELSVATLSKLHPSILAGLIISTVGTGERQRAEVAVKELGREDIVKVALQLSQHFYARGSRPTVEQLGAMADCVIRALGDPDAPPPPPEQEPEEEPQEGELPELPPVTKEPHFEGGAVGWGELRIKDVPLIRRLPGKMRGRRRVVPDIRGRRLRRVNRLHIDGKVFANRPPLPGGGAVLVDTSGSMQLSSTQVEEIVRALPGGIVATYAGHDSLKWGELRIVARNGRFCADGDIRPEMGHNIIDGPALEWLAKQRGPRYWVSDGKVTGLEEKQSPVLMAEITLLCKQHQIRRVASAEVLLGD